MHSGPFVSNRILWFFSVFFLFATTTFATDKTCKLGCKEGGAAIFKYEPNHVYEYAIDSVMTVGVVNGTELVNNHESGNFQMKISAAAKLYSEGNCAYTLHLSSVKVSSVDAQNQLENLEQPVQFTMQNDGKIEPEICIQNDEDPSILNIKRAIISLLQAQKSESGSDFHSEIDVFGYCRTRTTHHQHENNGGQLAVHKARNLGDCAHREHFGNGLIATHVVNEMAGLHNMPQLQANYDKQMKLQKGVVQDVNLEEVYDHHPSGAGGDATNAARAKVATTLKLLSQTGASTIPRMSDNAGTARIVFDHRGLDLGRARNMAALKTAFNDLVQHISGHVHKDAGRYFSELIRLMRVADANTLIELGNVPQPQNELAHKAFLDALFRVNTDASVRTILTLLPKLKKHEQHLAIISLYQVQSVDKITLKIAAGLINSNTDGNLYLAIGNLARKYCEGVGECSGDVTNELAQHFAQNLKQCKAATQQDEDRNVAILKGIGNMKYISNNKPIVQALTQCLAANNNRAISQRVRVAALQATANAASCVNSLQRRALDLLKDIQEDSEIRIESYLTAVACANAEVAKTVDEVLKHEPSHQVGGFIASHLRVLRDSTDDTRAQQREHLSSVVTSQTQQFPNDWRRYSANHEVSYKLPAAGASASADVKIIYSQQAGFLPRSARLNVTSELFGHNFNWLDLNVRQENFERLLEYYLGPQGLLSKDFEQIMNSLGGGSVRGSPRSRRSLVTESQKFSKKYKNYHGQPHTSNNNKLANIHLDMSLKLFGSEIGFLSLGDSLPQTVEDVMRLLSGGFEQTKQRLQNFQHLYKMHNMFIDREIIYSTSIGVPLEMSTYGFAVSQFDVATQLDVESIFTDNWSMNKYRVKLVPSVDVNVELRLGFRTPVINSGMRLMSQFYSATGNDIQLQFTNSGKGFQADIEMPAEKLELINLQMKADYYVSEVDKPTTKILNLPATETNAETSTLCFNQLEDTTGFNFCFITNIINSGSAGGTDAATKKIWPLSKPVILNVYVELPKVLQFSGNYEQTDASRSLQLKYSTPKSKENHDTIISFSLNHNKNVRFSLTNPKLKFASEIGLKLDQQEIVIYTQYEIDDKIVRNKMGFEKVNANEYKPVIEWRKSDNEVSHDIAGYQANGRLIVEGDEGDRKFTYNDFSITQNQNSIFKLNGWTAIKATSLQNDLHLQIGTENNADVAKYAIQNQFGIVNSAYILEFFINNEQTPTEIYGAAINAKISPQNVHLNALTKALQYEMNLNSKLEYKLAQTQSSGSGDNAADNAVLESFDSSHELIVKYQNEVAGALKLNAKMQEQKKLFLNVDWQRLKHKANLDVNLERHQKHADDYSANIKVQYNKHSLNIISKANVNEENGRYILNNELKSSWGTHITLQGQLGEHMSQHDLYVDLHGKAVVNSKLPVHNWQVKIVGMAEKTTADIKLLSGDEDILTFNADWQHQQDNKVQNGKAQILVKDLLSGKIDFKTAKNGKGELNVNGELLKAQSGSDKKKFDLNTKFHVQPPTKYDIETTLILNDNKASPIFHIKTDNSVDNKQKLSTSTVLEVGEKRVSLTGHGLHKGDLRTNGELGVDIQLILPSERTVDVQFKKKMTTNPKTGIVQGNVDGQINYKLQNGQQQHTLNVKGKLDKFQPTNRLFIYALDVDYKMLPDNRDFALTMHMKHEPKNHAAHSLDFELKTKGNLLKNPIELNIDVNNYNRKQAKYMLTGKYGSDISSKVSGEYKIDYSKNNKENFNKLHLNVDVPQSHFKKYELKASGKWYCPHHHYQHHDHESDDSHVLDDNDESYYEQEIEQKFGEHNDKYDFKWKRTAEKSLSELNLESTHLKAPLHIKNELQYHKKPQRDNALKGQYQLNLEYGEKYLKALFNADIDRNNLNMHYIYEQSGIGSSTPRDLEINLNGKHNENSNDQLNIVVMHNKNDKYELESTIYNQPHKRGLSMTASIPQFKEKMIIICVAERLTDDGHGKISLELAHVFDLDLQASIEAHYHHQRQQQILDNDFALIVLWNSEKLQLQKYELELKADPQQSQQLHLSLKNAKESIIKGSMQYAAKNETPNKLIIEGNGQFEFRGKVQQGNFRLTRQMYDINLDKEFGVSYSLNGQIGARQAVANLKTTNREFNSKLSICEEKKQCSNLQMQTISKSILVLIDLRELGYPYEFELQSKAQQPNIEQQQGYSLTSKLISHKMEYKLKAAVSPKSGVAEVIINLPQRTIKFESQQKIPENSQIIGHYERSVALWLDNQRQPDQVTRFIADIDIKGDIKSSANLKGSMKLEHPGMRTLSTNGKWIVDREKQEFVADLLLDVFRSPEQQIHLSHVVKNKGKGSNSNKCNWIVMSEMSAPAHNILYKMNAEIAGEGWSKLTSKANVKLQLSKSYTISGESSLNIDSEHLNGKLSVAEPSPILLQTDWTHNVLTSDNTGGIKGETKYQFLTKEPVLIQIEAQSSHVKFNVERKNSIVANADFNLAKELTINVNGPNGKNFVDGSISLDSENFLQTTYTCNLEELKTYLEQVEVQLQQEVKDNLNHLRAMSQEFGKQWSKSGEAFVQTLPDVSALRSSFENNLQTILQELEADPLIKEIAAVCRKIITILSDYMKTVDHVVRESYNNISKIFVDLYEKIVHVFESTFMPIFEDFVQKFSGIYSKIRVEVVSFNMKLWQLILQTFEKYAPIIREHAKTLHNSLSAYNDMYKEFAKMFAQELQEVRKELHELLKHEKLSSILNELKTNLEQYHIREHLIELFNHLLEAVRVLPMTQESLDFLQQLQDYVNNKFLATGEIVSSTDAAEIERLFKLAYKALTSILNEFTQQHAGIVGGDKKFSEWLPTHSLAAGRDLIVQSLNWLRQLPAIFSFRLSLINYIINETHGSRLQVLPWQVLRSAWYRLLSTPFELQAHIVNGQQFITFDGNYLDYKTENNCKLILVQDSIDNNFTLIAHQQNNRLHALTLITRNGETLEVNENGILKYMNEQIEYPYHGSNLHAWHLYYTVWLRSQYGIEIVCATDLQLCHVSVNGFYMGRLRGLLGNGNVEPYDDRMLPDGSLAQSNIEFGNNYALGKCSAKEMPKVKEIDETNVCSEVFAWDSTLSPGFFAMDVAPYRQGCNVAIQGLVSPDKEEEKGCEWAMAYVTALKLKHLPLLMPSRCLKCDAGETQHQLGQEETIKLPTNKIDVLFLVDLNTDGIVMSDVVAPAITEVREALKTRGFSDVKIGVIVYNETQRYPALLTSNGGHLDYQGNLKDVQLTGPSTFGQFLCDGCIAQFITNERLLEIYKHFEKILHRVIPNSEQQAYEIAFKYPFRAHASSAIVNVRGRSLSKSNIVNFVRAKLMGGLPNLDKTIFHLIAPLEKMTVEGLADDKLIGFNTRLIATLDGKDPKKRAKLQFDNNVGINLVLDSGGWVFSTTHVPSLKPTDRKKALSQITNTIADTSFKTEQVTECKCKAVYGMVAEQHCKVVSTNFLPNKKVKSKK